MITKFLLHGSELRTLSTLTASVKINRTFCSPNLRILKPPQERHRRVKVLAIASVLRARFVKNFAAMMYYWELWSLSREQLGPSLSERERFVQFCVISSITVGLKMCEYGMWWKYQKKKKKEVKLFPNPHERRKKKSNNPTDYHC